ncbi:hypothetical protein [Methylomonas sp. AM2-LC]|uniref:hypothetical protein n=1 Tax=Methylomonas sp. AM2-LC TaxID=3153301 RepID=UPI00326765BF
MKRLIQLLLLTSLIFSSYPLSAETDLSLQEILQKFDISAEQIAQLEHGEVISYEISESSHKELAIGIAMIMPVALPKILDYIKHSDLSTIETDIIASGNLTANADLNSFKKLAFSAHQLDEAKAFLEAEPGDNFNLSKLELEELTSLQANLNEADNKTLLTTANQKYREFLLQRFQAYQKNGLAGIQAYNREAGVDADAAAELRTDALYNKTWASYFPELQQAWENYPAALPAGTSEQFMWLNHLTENRPTAILIHRLMLITKIGGIMLSRQFYVGHSYNSSNIVAGGLPYKDGTLVFYSTRLSTDQITGLGSGLKHSIGREQMKDEMIARLKQINKNLKTTNVKTVSTQ